MDHIKNIAIFGSIYRKTIESILIVTLGTAMHLTSFNIIEWHFSDSKKTQPNVASIVVTISILSILASIRPLWPSGLHRPSKFLQFILEMTVILYVSDLLIRQAWACIVDFLDIICQAGSKFILSNPNGIKAKWMHTELFYIARFMAALITFYYMLNITGIFKHFSMLYKKYSMIETDSSSKKQPRSLVQDREDIRKRRINFNVTDLPNVPTEDLLDLANSVREEHQRRVKNRHTLFNGDNRFNNFQ